MTGKQLKNSILQWAIQGKLVPQDPNDEPASALLDKIRAEKARLIKEGKIKRDKKESIIYRGEDNSYYEKIIASGEVKCVDDEIPFEVPDGWEWCRFSSICECELGKALDAIKNTGEPMEYLTGINVYWNRFDFSQIRKMKMTDVEFDKYHLEKGDLIICEGGDAGRCAVWSSDKKIAYQKALHRARFYCNVNPFFYMFVLMLYQDALILEPYITGTTIRHLTNVQIKKLYVPLPPLNEQQRILAKLDELLPIVEQYGKLQSSLDMLTNNLNILLHKSILQEAIQGRLVPQDASDEPAYLLLQRIKDEKKRLVEEGKLKKKDVVNSTIFRGDDNKYYEQVDGISLLIETDNTFPDTWEVVKLAQICRLMDGEERKGNYICLDAKYLRGKSSGDILPKGKFVSTGDNIILVDGENSGEVFAVPHNGYMGSTFKQLWVSSNMHLPYVLYFIQFYKNLLRNSKKGAAIPHLNKELFYSLVVGIPPYQEQVRIANEIGELYAQL